MSFYPKIKSFLTFILFLQAIPFFIYSQEFQKTIVWGRVTEASTGLPLAGANVTFERSGRGTITDTEGRYRVETSGKAERLIFSFIGYQSEALNIIRNTTQGINISLKLTPFALGEVKVRPVRGHYRNKNNPSVDLIRKVIENRDLNRIDKFDYLSFRQYEKEEFALSNLREKSGKGELFKRYSFIFENQDTTKRLGKRTAPVYFREVLSDKYHRKNPESSREIIRGEKSVDLEKYFDNKGISAKLEYLYQDINIYDNEILFLKNKFISPIAASAPLFYKYYIIDTLQVNEYHCIRLFFEPRNKSDFLFQSYLYVTPYNNFAVMKADMVINKRANFDWIQGVSITQDFTQQAGNWFLSKEEITADYGILKDRIGLIGQRTVARTDYKTDNQVDKAAFSEPPKIERIDISSRPSEFWNLNRTLPLEKSEKRVYEVVDSLRTIPAFNRWMDVIMMFPNDFLNLGKIELGPEDSFFSSNPVEGTRIRAGGRTTPDLSKKVTIDGFMAYGLGDKNIKFRTEVTYSLTPKTLYEFPVKSISLASEKDVVIPSQELELLEADNFFASFKRGVDDKYFLNRTVRAEYLNEFENHFSFLLGYRYTRQSTEGKLRFNASDYLSESGSIAGIDISELYLGLRYAPNETFY